MNELFIVIINSLLYISFFLYSIKRKNNILILISVIWALSSIISILYFLNPYRIPSTNITLFPFIYLFVILLIGTQPFKFYNESSIDKHYITYNRSFFYLLIYILAILSFLPLVESIIQLAKVGGGNLANVYEMQRNFNSFNTRGYFSSIGWFCYSILDYFKFLTPTFLFIYITKHKTKKLILAGLFAAFINPLLNNLVNGQRFYFIVIIYMFTFNLILFWKLINPNIKKLIVKYFFVVLAFSSILILSISISRFGKYSNNEFGTTYQFIRYAGESFCNFNTEAFWVQDFTKGRNSFFGFYSYFTNEVISIEGQNEITGVITNLFYTYIGNFVLDYGVIGAFVILSIMALYFRFIYKKKKLNLNLGTIIQMNLYANVLLFGTTYFIYQNGFIAMLWAIFISFVFKILPINKSYTIK